MGVFKGQKFIAECFIMLIPCRFWIWRVKASAWWAVARRSSSSRPGAEVKWGDKWRGDEWWVSGEIRGKCQFGGPIERWQLDKRFNLEAWLNDTSSSECLWLCVCVKCNVSRTISVTFRFTHNLKCCRTKKGIMLAALFTAFGLLLFLSFCFYSVLISLSFLQHSLGRFTCCSAQQLARTWIHTYVIQHIES